ncbi:HD domain-containing protein [Spirosoma utsteinense]|uniref:Metal-dependent HD superfamily phosphohydrolase n=1 Tax=Spirosoma utsteinense TaxID=2585773 RepID=A0ABR6W0C2_9BACT|nr:HD domain-containing protein [Spirosoma utsteinense]MBC3788125.1 putative metal-dependent HD superfamily phosphohydrolase [Spirosoma utsteinense]MBC3790014.1 putative metal-dependent HD superfamily phosphohydrolase [Spirosoma utsteinense]
MNVADIKQFIVSVLATELSPTLYYHGLHHVLDVVEAADRIARAECITDTESLDLLRTAALFHDVGFLSTYKGHEEVGCTYVQRVLPDFGYEPEQIRAICGMIMATRIPQEPRTKLEEILCDADLDYLGRDDFEPIAHSLYKELMAREMVTDELVWNRIQVNFLGNHHYWTPTAIATRQAVKEKHLDTLKLLVGV